MNPISRAVFLLLGFLLGLLVLVGQGRTEEPTSHYPASSYRLAYNSVTDLYAFYKWREATWFREAGWYICHDCIPQKYISRAAEEAVSGVTGFSLLEVRLSKEEALGILKDLREEEAMEKKIKKAWRVVK